MATFGRRRFVLAGAALAYLGAALALTLTGAAGGCRRSPESARAAPAAPALPADSASCRGCHEEVFRAWSQSHHALAHRPVDAQKDAAAFEPPREFTEQGVGYRVAWQNGRPHLTEKRPDAPPADYTAAFVLGHVPLRQFIVPTEGGHYQAAELAFDPAKQEWFNVFGAEQRRPGEWGHWRGRGMNWNAMCAHCHVTRFAKNYDAAADTYASTWLEHGVGCVQCHGDLAPDHGAPGYRTRAAAIPDRVRVMETCAPCHARNELLTGALAPGAPYADHHRLTLPDDPEAFYPDGQMRGEVFNYTSFLTSRMGGKGGVTCIDCHEPHGGRLRLPANDNQLCQQCHSAPGRDRAPIIDPTAHSRHVAGSTGNACVGCHMPTTVYMQRDPRHDHGFLKPDPLLTQELGIPNACNRCHTDKDTAWAIAWSERWYGSRLESRQRARTRAVAAAQAGAPGAAKALLELLAAEEIPAWRATLLLLARPHAADPAVAAAAQQALADADPLVRSAAVQVLTRLPDAAARLRPSLDDPRRLVRLDAAWALSPELAADSPARRELDAYFSTLADQPAGKLRIAQDQLNRGRAAEAEAPLRRALEWEPRSAPLHATLGLALEMQGRSAEAAAALWRAAQLDPASAPLAFDAALAFAGAARLTDAETALREAIRRDPRHDRAWYNLGLLLAQTGRATEGIAALRQAETLAPNTPDYPYARATLHFQIGDRAAAVDAARRTLALQPEHRGAREILRAVPGR